MNDKKEKRISDIQLASYLRALDFRLVDVRPDGRSTEWVFSDVPQETILNYYNGVEDLVSARALYNAFRELKGLSYQKL